MHRSYGISRGGRAWLTCSRWSTPRRRVFACTNLKGKLVPPPPGSPGLDGRLTPATPGLPTPRSVTAARPGESLGGGGSDSSDRAHRNTSWSVFSVISRPFGRASFTASRCGRRRSKPRAWRRPPIGEARAGEQLSAPCGDCRRRTGSRVHGTNRGDRRGGGRRIRRGT